MADMDKEERLTRVELVAETGVKNEKDLRAIRETIAELLPKLTPEQKAELAEFESNPEPLIEELAYAMAISAGSLDPEKYLARAAQLLAAYEKSEGRLPHDYLEIEKWALARGSGS